MGAREPLLADARAIAVGVAAGIHLGERVEVRRDANDPELVGIGQPVAVGVGGGVGGIEGVECVAMFPVRKPTVAIGIIKAAGSGVGDPLGCEGERMEADV